MKNSIGVWESAFGNTLRRPWGFNRGGFTPLTRVSLSILQNYMHPSIHVNHCLLVAATSARLTATGRLNGIVVTTFSVFVNPQL